MITDLLRNELGQVCELDTVKVPILMEVESHPTVSGVLAQGVDTVDCVRAVFPGGSMTGAPKLRTMEIIDDVEADARGIVIRTIVAQDTTMSIGVGGGIVALSDLKDEYAEANLKAAALLTAVDRACSSPGS